MSPILAWAIVCAFCLVAEFVTVGDFISIWFAFGALTTCIVSIFGISFSWQISIFVIISALSILLLRPVCVKALSKSQGKTNLDTIIDSKIKLIEPILTDKMGTTKIDGIVWSCISFDDSEIASGTICIILEIKGNKLVVKPIYN